MDETGREHEGGPFRALFAFCRACGASTALAVCPACATPTAAPTRQPMGLTGARVTVRRRLRSVKGTVLDVVDGMATVLLDDDTDVKIAESALQEVVVAPRLSAYFPPSELLRVSRSGAPAPPVAHVLAVRCFERLGADVVAERGLLVDLTGLGYVDVVFQLHLTTSELAWWRVATLVEAGELAMASRELVDLDGPGYPLRLAVWARALADGRLGDVDARRVDDHLGPFVDQGGIVGLAALAVDDAVARRLGRTRRVDVLATAADTVSDSYWDAPPGAEGGPTRAEWLAAAVTDDLAAQARDGLTLGYGHEELRTPR